MVKELFVEAPEEKLSWDQERDLLYDFVYAGIELPDAYEKDLEERTGITPPSAFSSPATAAWVDYNLWRESHPEVEDMTPRDRLARFFSEKGE